MKEDVGPAALQGLSRLLETEHEPYPVLELEFRLTSRLPRHFHGQKMM